MQESLVVILVLVHNPLRGGREDECLQTPGAAAPLQAAFCLEVIVVKTKSEHDCFTADLWRRAGTGARPGWERVGADKTRLGTKSN